MGAGNNRVTPHPLEFIQSTKKGGNLKQIQKMTHFTWCIVYVLRKTKILGNTCVLDGLKLLLMVIGTFCESGL